MDIDITMACDISIFFSTKTMGKSILGIAWENTTLSTELSRDFYARIGPLQLGVVLFFFKLDMMSSTLELL